MDLEMFFILHYMALENEAQTMDTLEGRVCFFAHLSDRFFGLQTKDP